MVIKMIIIITIILLITFLSIGTNVCEYIKEFLLLKKPLGDSFEILRKQEERKKDRYLKYFYNKLLPKEILKSFKRGETYINIKNIVTFMHPISGKIIKCYVTKKDLDKFAEINHLSFSEEIENSYKIMLKKEKIPKPNLH